MLNEKGEIIALGANQRELLRDPVGHAEIVAIRSAARSLGNWRLDNCTLVVTLEPCAMCAGAIMQTRIPRVVFGAWDEKAGAAGSTCDLLRDPRALHKVEVISDVLKDECATLLKEFFSEQR
jgi:tRNA(adenine34) deaminase